VGTRSALWLAALSSILLTAAGAALGAGVGSGSSITGVFSTPGTTTTTNPGPYPDPPTQLAATPTSNGVTLTWQPPSFDGGSAIVGYVVFRWNEAGGDPKQFAVGNVTSYTDVNTAKGVSYIYEVSATNATGTGSVSNYVVVTALGPGQPPIFGPYQSFPTGSWPEAVALGDVTGDGRADAVMVTSAYFSPTADHHVFVFAQNADGTLAAPVSYLTAATSNSDPATVAVGDITGDGRNDVLVGIDKVGVQLFPQLASGLLGSPTTVPTTNAEKIRVGQLNGDGKLDVVGIGWGTNTVGVLFNNGGGGLSAPVTYAAPHGGYDDLEVGDVSGDGRDDIVVMSGQSFLPNISVLPQLSTGGFGQTASYSLPGNVLTGGIGVGDVNGDGRNDVVTDDWFDDKLAVFPQTALGTLGTPVLYPGPGSPAPVEVADLDADGRADVLVDDGGATVYRQRADGTLAPKETYTKPGTDNPHGLAVGDINGDRMPDVVSASFGYGLVVLRNVLPPPGATVPGAPAFVSAVPGKLSVTLTWKAPASTGGASVTGYRIYRGTSAGAETFFSTAPAEATSFVDTRNLAGGTKYYYRVSAVNAVGEGAASNEVSATPTAASVPDAPALTEANIGYDSVFLDWTEPASNGGAEITAYRVYRGTASGAETLYATTTSAYLTNFLDSGATGGTKYYYRVSAVNAVGEGALSNELSATPLTPRVPDPPTLAAATGDYSTVHLVWKRSSDGGAEISAYKVYRGTTSGGETLLTTLGSSATAYDDSSGVNGTTYFYEVKAVNSVGDSAFSNELSATPIAPSAPGAPTLRQATAGFSSVSLAWDAPGFNGGVALGGFKVYRGTASGNETLLTTLANVTSYTDTSGVSGTLYYYRVTAFNSVGESVPSNELSAVPVRRLFDPYQAYFVGSWPQAVAIGDVTGDGRNDVVLVTSSYFDPANDYHVFVFAQRADGTLAPPVSYPTAGTPASVAVGDVTGDGRADVVVGLDGYGVQVFPQISAGALGTPTVTAYADTRLIRLGQLDGDGRLDVASAGRSTVAVFLNDAQGGFKQPTTYPVAAGDLEIADVTGEGRDDLVGLAGNNVYVWPQLTDGLGPGAASYPTGANAWGTWGIGTGDLTGDGRTDVVVSYGGNWPNSFIAVLAQNQYLELDPPIAYPSLDIPEPIDTADFDLDGRADVALLHGGYNTAGIHRQRPDGTLFPEERYGIPYASHYWQQALAAEDFTGDGSPDLAAADYNNGLVVLRNTTAPANAPAAPALTAAIADKAAINLTWTPPHAAGGSPSGYRVYRGTASGGETLLASIGTASSYADDTAVPGTTYWYQVRAVNSRGEGARSTERSATRPFSDPTPPTVPGGLKLVVAGTNQLALDWAPSTDNVGVAAYRVYRNSVLVATVPQTQYVDAGLAAATSYAYQVRAVDAAGNASAASATLTAKTVAQATSPTGTVAGAVYDATGTPLASAVVTVGSKSAKTNASGAWKVSNLKPGTYTETVGLSGYRGQTFNVAAVAGKTVLTVVTLTK
jgi:fibronectin type 3 domain-containing protein